jgi:acyl-CoA dehydrogenase
LPAAPLNLDDFGGEIFDLRLSPAAREILAMVREFMAEEIEPATTVYRSMDRDRPERWDFAPSQLELLDSLKQSAKDRGLWNLFLAGSPSGAGLSNVDYAHIVGELGKNALASECLNCSAPDTGNMELLEQVGTAEQRQEWLEPLLNGSIRSSFAMTEPGVASSDARNISTEARRDGDDWVINGEKIFITGAGDPRCKIMICMAKSDPDAPPHQQHSQILIPMDTPGVEILGPMLVFGDDHAPRGHMHIRLRNVRVPRTNTLLGEGQGFEISQLRLGSGRLHHCMRSVGAAEKALELMVERGLNRQAFGSPLIKLGKNVELVSRARIGIEAMRLMVLRAAQAMDLMSTRDAQVWVSVAKAMVPERARKIIGDAMQVYGAVGLSDWTPLAEAYALQRAIRYADGPMRSIT